MHILIDGTPHEFNNTSIAFHLQLGGQQNILRYYIIPLNNKDTILS